METKARNPMETLGRGMTAFRANTPKFKGVVLSQYRGRDVDGQAKYEKAFLTLEQLEKLFQFSLKWSD